MKSNSGTVIDYLYILLIIFGITFSSFWIAFEATKSERMERVSNFHQQIFQTGDSNNNWEFIDSDGKEQKLLNCSPNSDKGDNCLVTEDHKISFVTHQDRGINNITVKMLANKKVYMFECVSLGDNLFVQRLHCGL